ncbi:hypothetical protein WR25_24988 [Diploscapter pachys]|uniref:Uncharacterized protein n=1 Tax=Diploscapter pachys TaxID=2018661 RepID=A0A2A2JGD5_9BILA|nr:hypothetical protein WR25_24988 [Diploscapter pachys]
MASVSAEIHPLVQKSTLTYDAFSKQLKGLTSEKKKLLDQISAELVSKDTAPSKLIELAEKIEGKPYSAEDKFMTKLGKDGLKNIDTVLDEAYNDVYLKLKAHAEKIGLNDDIRKLVDKKVFEFPSKIKYFE